MLFVSSEGYDPVGVQHGRDKNILNKLRVPEQQRIRNTDKGIQAIKKGIIVESRIIMKKWNEIRVLKGHGKRWERGGKWEREN